jgi:protein-L-isoaspartate(D-aspartate) O-methyltransferase
MIDYASARQKMVDGQVRPNGFTDLRLIEALLSVPREVFVPETSRKLAYLDLDLDVSGGQGPKRCLLKPAILGRLLQSAEITPDSRVLVAGCATGYTAAVVGQLAASVVATEADPALAVVAQAALKAAGAANVRLIQVPVTAGDPGQGPYDVIILDGATEVEPKSLYDQLKMGGRLLGIFANSRPPRAEVVTRSPGDFGHRPLFDAYAAVLPGLARPAEFVF